MRSLSKINNPERKAPRVLVAPLDWGLGHATRCIPIIKELINQECEVWIAASGHQKTLLQTEFPFLSFVELPGYGIIYGKNRAFTFLKILASVPKIMVRIRWEHRWLRGLIREEHFDAIISDNRYGLHLRGMPTVFITHQLGIQTSLGAFADLLLRRINYRHIDRFSDCWIPDLAGKRSLAGALSHPGRMPGIPTRYIGVLSRFTRQAVGMDGQAVIGQGAAGASADAVAGGRIDLLVVLSGPEPQRTLLEGLILSQLPAFSGRVVLVRGLPGRAADVRAGLPGGLVSEGGGGGASAGAEPLRPTGVSREVRAGSVADNFGEGPAGLGLAVPGRLAGTSPAGPVIIDHLPAADLNVLMQNAALVLSRAGYSTVMDLARLQKRSVLIPTPGQTEQEYLGGWLQEARMALSIPQKGFSLAEALEKAAVFPFSVIETDSENLLRPAIVELMDRIRGTSRAAANPPGAGREEEKGEKIRRT